MRPVVFGTWFLVLGTWFLVLGTLFLVLGTLFLVLGKGSSDFGQGFADAADRYRTPVGALGHQLVHQIHQSLWRLRIELTNRRRLVQSQSHQRRHDIFAIERLAPRDHVIKHAAEAE